MKDYNEFITTSPVFSEKLKRVISDIPVKDVQFVPIVIFDKSNETIEGYRIIKVRNIIDCADLEQSEYDLLSNGKIGSFEKLVLDSEKLDQIPLEGRLIFSVGEKKTYVGIE